MQYIYLIFAVICFTFSSLKAERSEIETIMRRTVVEFSCPKEIIIPIRDSKKKRKSWYHIEGGQVFSSLLQIPVYYKRTPHHKSKPPIGFMKSQKYYATLLSRGDIDIKAILHEATYVKPSCAYKLFYSKRGLEEWKGVGLIFNQTVKAHFVSEKNILRACVKLVSDGEFRCVMERKLRGGKG